jgi:hypothetical protein
MRLSRESVKRLDELRQYILTHREDTTAFYAYIDRSKADSKGTASDKLHAKTNRTGSKSSICAETNKPRASTVAPIPRVERVCEPLRGN